MKIYKMTRHEMRFEDRTKNGHKVLIGIDALRHGVVEILIMTERGLLLDEPFATAVSSQHSQYLDRYQHKFRRGFCMMTSSGGPTDQIYLHVFEQDLEDWLDIIRSLLRQ